MTNAASPSLRLFLVVALALLLALTFAAPRSATAGGFVVTKTADTADGSCDAGDCSLREAIVAANLSPGDITLPAGTYTLSVADPINTEDNTGAAGDLDMKTAFSINGAGADTTIIDAAALNRVFHVQTLGAGISGVTIRNGLSGNGGGIYVASGSLTLDNSTVTGNVTKTSGNGGGIFSQATLTVTNSTISGNTATGANGGGVYAFSAGTVSIINSTVSGNTALFGGGGIYNNTPVVTNLTNVTVSNNTSTTASSGGGIRNNGVGGVVNLKNTIVANSPSGGNCSGTMTSAGNNLDDGTTCGLNGSGDLSSADDGLVALALNVPGTTQTHALLPSSDAINAGGGCPPPATDQRGVTRPQGSACDIGAYESDPRGDTDCNGKVEGPDLLDVLSDVADVGTPAACHANGDVDGDGQITAMDALLIAHYWAGVITTFPNNGN